MQTAEAYKPLNRVRILTATTLFDGHDAAINIIRRILQASGAEVIHLGHNRSALEIVDCAIQEDVQAIAISSYQGGHIEFYKYLVDLFKQRKAGHIRIFGGGGGVILPDEMEELHSYGICRIYSPDDGRILGLQGIINDMLQKCDFPVSMPPPTLNDLSVKNFSLIAQAISAMENNQEKYHSFANKLEEKAADSETPVMGITGTGGSGKSSLIDELILRMLEDFPAKYIAIISVDPSKRKSGGALLGDRIRMNAIHHPHIFMRSLATRQSNLALSKHIKDILNIVKCSHFDLIILETSGIGQSDTEIIDFSNLSMYVMTPDFGAATQLEKIDMLDFADIIALNKFDKRGAQDALSAIKKQFVRNHLLWDMPIEEVPVYGTIASQFNDTGVDRLYHALINLLNSKTRAEYELKSETKREFPEKISIIPPNRVRYLAEISETIHNYNTWSEQQAHIADKIQHLTAAIEEIFLSAGKEETSFLKNRLKELRETLESSNRKIIENWENKKSRYQNEFYIYKVRGEEIKIKTHSESLSHLKIPKISLPAYSSWGDILKWNLRENVPGEFPFAGGVFPFKRENEDPTRMFAGEGGPERTNRRFHYLSHGMPARRLSTAFDSVTLYGEDPDTRPDIYGKIGNSGVSVCCLDDAKKLYSGFDLTDRKTSVSMTINGPAPMMAGYFMNTAIDQQCEKYIRQNGMSGEVEDYMKSVFDAQNIARPAYQGALPEGNNSLGLLLLGVTGDQILPAEVYEKIKKDTLNNVRGTIQADILKEDQAQNTCIFSTDFSLKLMGDVQEYFTLNHLRNFYSVSISGYHIAEAGANPITQLAFTLANGFTYVEYYLSRGMKIDELASNLSFFFSNGIDAEFSVIGRVARIIWAKAMKLKYHASERSQMLKYHIQTSGRSLHAQEIDFNDIRTTLQALYAVYDNCNSLHTNAYDEAITTPTEESVRRAMAIQLIINHEMGLAKNQNPLQGSFIIEELTNLVEEAVMTEFDKINERGGVLGAMENMYQRNKIQEESLYYETLKHSGELPIMGVNTFLSSKGSPTILPKEVIRSTETEKNYQIEMLKALHQLHRDHAPTIISDLKVAVRKNQNIFEHLMNATKYCSIGQLTKALFEVGGMYRRNM